MDWVTGAMTILAMELVGRKHWAGWLVGLVNQAFWAYLIYYRELWGLAPLTAILTWRYATHLYTWKNAVRASPLRVEWGRRRGHDETANEVCS